MIGVLPGPLTIAVGRGPTNSQQLPNCPLHKGMLRPNGHLPPPPVLLVCTSIPTNLGQHLCNVLLGRGDRPARLANLGHGRTDQEGVEEQRSHTYAVELLIQCPIPADQEGLAAGVGGQERRGHRTRKGAEVEDQALLALARGVLHQQRYGDSAHAQGGTDIDLGNSFDLLHIRLGEEDGDGVGHADVVDQDTQVERGEELFELLEIILARFGKIDCNRLDLGRGVGQA